MKIPKHFIDAIGADPGNCVLIVGAGLSKVGVREGGGGLPDWDELMKAMVSHLEDSGRCDETKIKTEAAKWKSLRELNTFLESKSEEYAAAVQEAQQEAQAMPDGEPKQKALAEANTLAAPPSIAELKSEVEPILERGLSMHIWDNYVKQHVPKFLYFDEYYQMTGQLNIEELKKRQAERRLLGVRSG